MTAIEFMQKQLRKCEINLEREEQRGASEEVLQNIRSKIRYYEEAVEALGGWEENAGDAVEVVRCLYCIHAEMDDPDFPDEYYCHAGCGWNKADFFCAYAKRRKDDG